MKLRQWNHATQVLMPGRDRATATFTVGSEGVVAIEMLPGYVFITRETGTHLVLVGPGFGLTFLMEVAEQREEPTVPPKGPAKPRRVA